MWLKELSFGAAAGSAGLAFIGFFLFMSGHGSEGWPTAAGRVLSCEVIHRRNDDSADTWEVHVRYAYTVQATAHEGFRVAFWAPGTSFYLRASAEAYCAAQPVDVTVWYEPTFPRNSTLRPGGHPLGPVMTYGGGATTLICLVLAMIATVVEQVQATRLRARLQRELHDS